MQAIDSVQEAVLREFPQARESELFYLTGGTALAQFYLQHRRSRDLDFFTSTEELIDPFSRRLEERLRAVGMSVERQRGLHSFVELVATQPKGSTLIHLAQDSPFRFEPVREFPEFPHLKVDSLMDVATNKLLALFGRATLRDFIDVYALIHGGYFQPKDLMEKAKQKDIGFDPYWLAVAFERIKAYPEDSPDMLMLLKPIPLEELQSFFNRWREDLSRELKS